MPDIISPIAFFREAVKAVPALKWALGVGGIAAIVAIVYTFKLDARAAVFGVVIMFVFMTVLVIFAKISSLENQNIALPALVFTWFALSIFIVTTLLLLSSVFFQRPVDLRYWLSDVRQTEGPLPVHPDDALPSQAELPETRVSSFNYTASDPGNEGLRYWTRVAPDRWQEQAASKNPVFFSLSKRISYAGCDGSVVVKRPDPNLEFFIPDRNCETMFLQFRRKPSGNWVGLNVMDDVK